MSPHDFSWMSSALAGELETRMRQEIRQRPGPPRDPRTQSIALVCLMCAFDMLDTCRRLDPSIDKLQLVAGPARNTSFGQRTRHAEFTLQAFQDGQWRWLVTPEIMHTMETELGMLPASLGGQALNLAFGDLTDIDKGRAYTFDPDDLPQRLAVILPPETLAWWRSQQQQQALEHDTTAVAGGPKRVRL